MGKATRYCKLDESHSGPNVFDVSRPNIFGNPYTHIKDRTTKALVKVKSRNEAIDLYDAYFDKMLAESKEFQNEWERMFDAYCNYDEIFIGCFCHLDERCHSDIIIRKLKQRAVKAMLLKLKVTKPDADS